MLARQPVVATVLTVGLGVTVVLAAQLIGLAVACKMTGVAATGGSTVIGALQPVRILGMITAILVSLIMRPR